MEIIQKQKFGNWFRTSITARMLVVGFILLILLIPLGFVKDLIRERGHRQHEVIAEINSKWGNEVVLYGPIVKIPYKTYQEKRTFNEKTKEYDTNYEAIFHNAYFFPETLNADTKIDTKPLERGIYESVVFSSDINVAGAFSGFDFSEQEIPDKDVLWEKATVIFKTTNLKGLRNEIQVNLGREKLVLKPKFDNSYSSTLESGYVKELKAIDKGALRYTLDIEVNGSERLKFVPIGKETHVAMVSNWPSPSFTVNF